MLLSALAAAVLFTLPKPFLLRNSVTSIGGIKQIVRTDGDIALNERLSALECVNAVGDVLIVVEDVTRAEAE